jgi:uncharacterized ferredoxin-like protein
MTMDGVDLVAKLMVIAATTAPKSKGENYVRTRLLDGQDIAKLADAMEQYGRRTGKKDFDRDAAGVRRSPVVVLIGIQNATVVGLDCGACGFADCRSLQKSRRSNKEFLGPQCAFRLLDMGIALGSAVKTAGQLNVDNRIMYRIGAVVRQLGIVDWDFVMGVPLSVTGKNIFFDR